MKTFKLLVSTLVVLLLGFSVTTAEQTMQKKEVFIKQINGCYTSYYKVHTGDVTIPNVFVTAIAIHESGWGTSRFAKEGHNYFGIRTTATDPKHFMIAGGDANVKVAVYDSICDNVEYFINLIAYDPRYSNVADYFKQNKQVTDYKEVLSYMNIYHEDPLWPSKVAGIISSLQNF